MKTILLAVLLVFSTVIFPSGYKKVKVFINDQQTIALMQQRGINVDEVIYNRSEKTLVMFVNDHEFNLIKNMGLSYQVLIDNWNEYYKNRKKLSSLEKKTFQAESADKFGVSGFGFGSMGGFYKLEEIYARLDSMHAKYPDLISAKDSIGHTYENRPIYAVKISNNPSNDGNKPGVLYTSLIHAREPEGMMIVMYYMYYLLENYNSNPEVKYLVNNREMYFIPVVNPDGYFYNEMENPDGGGLWRKNRRRINDSTYGVDINRNFGPYEFWNSGNNGSSTEATAEDYRGSGPFSEPETETIKNFLLNKKIKTCLNYHTYSNLLIYPYGALSKETPDSLIYREYSQDLTSVNNYTYGLDWELLYHTRGNSDDFMYGGDTASRGKILAMTPEAGIFSDGVNDDGFWPMQDRIFFIAQQNLYSNLYIAWVAGSYVKFNSCYSTPYYFTPGDSVTLHLNLKNKGILPSDNITLSLKSLNTNATIPNQKMTVPPIREHTSLDLEYAQKIAISRIANDNDKIKLLLETYSGNLLISQDTINFLAGKPMVLFSDSCKGSPDLWQFTGTSIWGITTKDYHSSPACYTDSKDGNYPKNSRAEMTTKGTIDLTGAVSPVLSFWTKYDIEKAWDYGLIEISADNGTTWIPLEGRYSREKYNEDIKKGSIYYDGSQLDWVNEKIDLSQYIGSMVKIRFVLNSKSQFPRDGWYLDDINIFSYPSIPAVVTDQNAIYSFKLEQNYPNPFNPVTTIKYTIPTQSPFNKGGAGFSRGGFVTLKVYDILGREIATLVNKEETPGNYQVEFDGSKLSTGIYIYKLQAGSFRSSKKMVILK